VSHSPAKLWRSLEFPWREAPWPGTIARPPRQKPLGSDYDTAWSRRKPARVARALLMDLVGSPLVRLVTTPKVIGAELLDLVEEPVILVANHVSHADTGLVLYALPPRMRHRTVVAAAADHFFDRRWKAHLWAFALAAIPIERNRVDRASARLAATLLEEGWNLLIFPEGGRSDDGWQQPFKGGAAYLAATSKRPVVPLHLEGTRHVLPKSARNPASLRRYPCMITIGKPIVAAPDEDARRLAQRIESAVAVLADEVATDFFGSRRRQAEGTTPSPRGPETSPWRRAFELDRRARRQQTDRAARRGRLSPWDLRA
jgi:1-acyl-sn-glycerol-3-phosphate acyltransferase